MIKMSVEKEVLTLQVPALPSEQLRSPKTHPLHLKNGVQPSHQPPSQRIGKRRYSLGVGFKGLAKRRRRANSDSQSEPVLPSNFLLGGNIFDPLNLNSLLDEEVNRSTNQATPKCSPLPSRGGDPVEILVPRDITDPLNLEGAGGVLLSPMKTRKRPRNRHHAVAAETRSLPPAVPPATRGVSVPPSPLPCELNTSINCRDDVVPPLGLPRRHTHPPLSQPRRARNRGDGSHGQGGDRHRRRRRTTSVRSSESAAAAVAVAVAQPTRFQTPLVGGAKPSRCGGVPGTEHPSQKKTKNRHRYQHGGHSRYYGYHGFYGDQWEGRVGAGRDPRLRLLKPDWFKERRVLDIGCGSGHVTLTIARHFGPAHILGLDRDQRLVDAATHNVRHFLSHDLVHAERRQGHAGKEARGGEGETSFPLSFRVSRGPLAAPFLRPSPAPTPTPGFPSNITFITGDYVCRQESWPGRGTYDVILCLGVTKWVQLQSGDAGVVRLFKRAFQSLSPGGMFILESQPWSSYSHSKKASETTYQNYRTLRLRPEDYSCHLTQTTGFTSYRLLTESGDQRPVYVFHKGPSQRK